MAQRIMKEQEFESDVFDRGTWQKVFQLLWEHKKIVIPLIFFNTILAVTDVIMPLLNRYALNTYVDDQTGADTLPVFILVYVGMILAQCLLVYLFFRLAARVESDFGKNLREKCFRKLQEQTFSYFDRTANGWLMARITSDTARLAETLAWAFVDVVWGIFVMLGISVVMLLVNWQMALCVLVVVPLLWFVSLYFHRRILSAQRQSRKANSRITASFAEGINGAKTTKTLGIEQQNYNEFQKKTDDMKRYSMRALRINAIFQPIVYLLSAVVIALLLYVGGEQVLLKTIQFGTLAMFINYAQLFFDPLKQIARVLAEIQMAQASAERVVALLEEEIEITDYPDVIERYGTLLKEHTDAYEPLYGDVVFDHVNFYYYENEPVLRDFCLQVKKGQTVALVGETGSGRALSHDECAALMALPVLAASARGEPVGSRNRHLRPAMEHRLDRLISGEEFIRKVLAETDSAEKEAVNALKSRTTERKIALDRDLDALRFQVKTAKSALEKELSRMERMSLQRRCSKLTMELRQAEQNLFMRRSILDKELDEQVQEVMDSAQLTAKIERLFVIQVIGDRE